MRYQETDYRSNVREVLGKDRELKWGLTAKVLPGGYHQKGRGLGVKDIAQMHC